MSKPRVAINGLGRIGKMILRANIERELVDIVAVNNTSPPAFHAHLLNFDSTYGRLLHEIVADEKNIIVNGKKIPVFQTREPLELPWKDLGIDVVLECTGAFRERAGAAKHITAGAKRVIISAPGKEVDATFVMGVNDDTFDPEKHFIVSNASCTTNCLAPLAKVIDDRFGIEKGFITTVHSYTNDQNLLDNKHPKDWRRARAGVESLIPTTTGAARAIGDVLPKLAGKLNGAAVRAPTPTVSLLDLVCEVKNPPKDATELNRVLEEAAKGEMKGIMEFEKRPLVSVDFKQNPHSTIVDAEFSMVLDNMIKVYAWYDNEWGYSVRTLELASKIGAN